MSHMAQVRYLTHKEMRSRLRQIKEIDSSSRVIGLDIGRRWTGLSVSDAQLLTARPFKTIELKSTVQGVQGDIQDVYRQIKNAIRSKHAKGLIVGYPLDDQNQPSKHCDFIEEFLRGLAASGPFKTPVTLVNEYGSSIAAKTEIAKRVNLQTNIMLEARKMDLLLTASPGKEDSKGGHVGFDATEQALNPNVLLRKGIYDKVAAKVVLQRYLDFHHDLS